MKVDLFSIGKITIHSYGVLIALGIVLCVCMGMYRAKRKDLKPDAVIDLAILCVICGFIGAKLFFVLLSIKTFVKDPLSVLGSSGFVVYGGIILGVISAMIYCKAKKIAFWEYFDLLAPSVALAQAFGRLGCFMAGCCYGKETHAAWGVVFPEGSFAPAGVRLIPTQLISSAGDFAIVILLILFSRRSRRTGDVGAMYLLCYGIGRFLVEFLRTNEQGGFGIFTTAQIVSMVIVAVSVIVFLRNRKAEN